MPVSKAGAKPRPLRLFPPSLAGSCLRYAVMEVLGFGRLIEPESQAAMRAGSDQHKLFQAELLEQYALCQVEVPLKDSAWGVSGRLDALVQTPDGPWVVEYKTVSPERFDVIVQQGPPTTHWAQLQLYLAVGDWPQGTLVVERRPDRQRLIFRARADQEWNRWLKARIALVRGFQARRRLPDREVGQHCLSCDRWQRCFKDEADRADQVADHPMWDPQPRLPAGAPYRLASDVVSS